MFREVSLYSWIALVMEGGRGKRGKEEYNGGRRKRRRRTHHRQRPDGVVQEDDGGGHEHGEADESAELRPER